MMKTTAHRWVDEIRSASECMSRILDTAPYITRCSDDKTATLYRPREYAIRWPYMRVNPEAMQAWLIFDLDHSHPYIWEDAGLPPPNLIVRNRQTNHSHLYYAIVPVCTSENARKKPIEYLAAIKRAMTTRLQADDRFVGVVSKTPHHPWWTTTEIHSAVYELGELADHVDLEFVPHWVKKSNSEAAEYSRNCTLFDELRFYAYSIVQKAKRTGNYQQFHRDLESYADEHNNFKNRGYSDDLPYSSIKATVKSVAKWTWDKYIGDCANRGVMQLSASLPQAKRQSLAAKRTHQLRKDDTAKSILLACKKLLRDSLPLSFTNVAKVARLSRQTVSKYKHVVNNASKHVPVISLQEVFNSRAKTVKNAVSDNCPCLRSSGSFSISRIVKVLPVSMGKNALFTIHCRYLE